MFRTISDLVKSKFRWGQDTSLANFEFAADVRAAPKTPKVDNQERLNLFLAAYNSAISEDQIGVGRIFVELFDSAEVVTSYRNKYRELLRDVSKRVLQSPHFIPGSLDSFLEESWRIFRFEYTPKYGFNRKHRIVESLDKNEWDCDNSAFFFYDLAKLFDFTPRIIFVPGHALLKIEGTYLETTSGQLLNQVTFNERYPERVSECTTRIEIHEVSVRDTQVLDADLKLKLQSRKEGPSSVEDDQLTKDCKELLSYYERATISKSGRKALAEAVSNPEIRKTQGEFYIRFADLTHHYLNGNPAAVVAIFKTSPPPNKGWDEVVSASYKILATSELLLGVQISEAPVQNAAGCKSVYYSLKAYEKYRQGDVGGSESLTNTAIWLDPQNMAAHVLRCELSMRTKSFGEEFCESAVVLLKNRVAIGHLYLGLMALEKKDPIAQNCFDYLLQTSPTLAIAKIGLAQAQYQKGEKGSAKTLLDEGVGLQRDFNRFIPFVSALGEISLVSVRNEVLKSLSTPHSIGELQKLYRAGLFLEVYLQSFLVGRPTPDSASSLYARAAGILGSNGGRELLRLSHSESLNQVFSEPFGRRNTVQINEFFATVSETAGPAEKKWKEILSDIILDSSDPSYKESTTSDGNYLRYLKNYPNDLSALNWREAWDGAPDKTLVLETLRAFDRVKNLMSGFDPELIQKYSQYLRWAGKNDRSTGLLEQIGAKYSRDLNLLCFRAEDRARKGDISGAEKLLSLAELLPHKPEHDVSRICKLRSDIMRASSSPAEVYRYLRSVYSTCEDKIWYYQYIAQTARSLGEITTFHQFLEIAERKFGSQVEWEREKNSLLQTVNLEGKDGKTAKQYRRPLPIYKRRYNRRILYYSSSAAAAVALIGTTAFFVSRYQTKDQQPNPITPEPNGQLIVQSETNRLKTEPEVNNNPSSNESKPSQQLVSGGPLDPEKAVGELIALAEFFFNLHETVSPERTQAGAALKLAELILSKSSNDDVTFRALGEWDLRARAGGFYQAVFLEKLRDNLIESPFEAPIVELVDASREHDRARFDRGTEALRTLLRTSTSVAIKPAAPTIVADAGLINETVLAFKTGRFYSSIRSKSDVSNRPAGSIIAVAKEAVKNYEAAVVYNAFKSWDFLASLDADSSEYSPQLLRLIRRQIIEKEISTRLSALIDTAKAEKREDFDKLLVEFREYLTKKQKSLQPEVKQANVNPPSKRNAGNPSKEPLADPEQMKKDVETFKSDYCSLMAANEQLVYQSQLAIMFLLKTPDADPVQQQGILALPELNDQKTWERIDRIWPERQMYSIAPLHELWKPKNIETLAGFAQYKKALRSHAYRLGWIDSEVALVDDKMILSHTLQSGAEQDLAMITSASLNLNDRLGYLYMYFLYSTRSEEDQFKTLSRRNELMILPATKSFFLQEFGTADLNNPMHRLILKLINLDGINSVEEFKRYKLTLRSQAARFNFDSMWKPTLEFYSLLRIPVK